MQIVFARKRDAEAAIAAIEAAGINSGDDIVRVGMERVRQICCEAMQW